MKRSIFQRLPELATSASSSVFADFFAHSPQARSALSGWTPPRVVDLELTPFEAALALRHQPGMVFLDSATMDQPNVGGNDNGLEEPRHSLLAARPVKILRGHIGDTAALQEALRRYQPWSGDAAVPDLGFPSGGAIGSIDYDGTFCFGIYPQALIYDHRAGQWLDCGGLSEHLQDSQASKPLAERRSVEFRARMRREHFCRMVERAQEYISAGDIYQVNLAQRFCAQWDGGSEAALAWYSALREASPATHAAFLDLDGRQVMSSSPELFLEISGSLARTRPIKGTRPRFRDPELDERSAYDLITSPKEVAELIMITDLERNDLGQICEFGTVKAAELLKLERHQHIFHLVSTVEGQVRSDVSHLDAIAACFPGGSITGAPKKRAREIIGELEPEPRGLYTGAIGVIGFEAEAETRLSIAIRTAVAEAGELHFHVGAGIVADSDPQLEYEETLHKARGLFAANGA